MPSEIVSEELYTATLEAVDELIAWKMAHGAGKTGMELAGDDIACTIAMLAVVQVTLDANPKNREAVVSLARIIARDAKPVTEAITTEVNFVSRDEKGPTP